MVRSFGWREFGIFEFSNLFSRKMTSHKNVIPSNSATMASFARLWCFSVLAALTIIRLHSVTAFCTFSFYLQQAPLRFRPSSLGSAQSNDNDMNDDTSSTRKRHLPLRRAFLLSSLLAGAQFWFAQAYAPPGFTRIPTQFMAALGDPAANEGSGAQAWGLWKKDPGPRGVFLRDYQSEIVDNNNTAPVGWSFDSKDWWLEEHGIIMEAPSFPVSPGRYLVTGGRFVTTGLTIDVEGNWKLDNGTLYDVTHLPCRSARYTSTTGTCSPTMARQSDFPVTPGATMPPVEGCNKQDYAVIFVIGKETSTDKEL